MRTQQISSFDDLRLAKDNFERADEALASSVAKGQAAAIAQAFRAGANPLQAQDESGRHLFLQALEKDNGEELVCMLLNHAPPLERVGRAGDDAIQVMLGGGHIMTVLAHDEDLVLLDRLERFLADVVLWRANFPTRENEELDHLRLRAVNRQLLEGARRGERPMVETAMAEGAAALATDEQGKPALAWACDHPNHALLMGTILANDPSVALVELDASSLQGLNNGSAADVACLRNTAYARMGKGGVAIYLPPEPVEMGLPAGHYVCVAREHLSPTLRAHLHTLDLLGQGMGELTVELTHRGMPTQLRWPNQVDFQRLLADRFADSLAEVGAGNAS